LPSLPRHDKHFRLFILPQLEEQAIYDALTLEDPTEDKEQQSPHRPL